MSRQVVDGDFIRSGMKTRDQSKPSAALGSGTLVAMKLSIATSWGTRYVK
jgi:hypothetical protein